VNVNATRPGGKSVAPKGGSFPRRKMMRKQQKDNVKTGKEP